MTLDPGHIVDFCRRHPIDWKNSYIDAIRRGAPGDIMPPTPAADAFFKMLKFRHGELMTQAEYAKYCLESLWHDWATSLDPRKRSCIEAKLYRNFYPSFIDSLHVWALLGTRYSFDRKLVFDRCILDTQEDVITKTDLLLYRGKECIRLALTVNTLNAKNANEYKHRVRGNHVLGTVELVMKVGIKYRGPGNKCWFCWPDDFWPIFRKAEQLWLLEPAGMVI